MCYVISNAQFITINTPKAHSFLTPCFSMLDSSINISVPFISFKFLAVIISYCKVTYYMLSSLLKIPFSSKSMPDPFYLIMFWEKKFTKLEDKF